MVIEAILHVFFVIFHRWK